LGLGRAAALARATASATCRAAALRHQRSNARSALVERRRTSGLAQDAVHAGVRRRFAPHQLRHAHAVELAREGVPLIVIQRQLGHSNLGITSVYLQGIDNAEIIETVRARRQPMIPVSTSPPR
jgi:site-specific recombinase XerD